MKLSVGEVNLLKKKKIPDPPGLVPGDLACLSCSNSLITCCELHFEGKTCQRLLGSAGNTTGHRETAHSATTHSRQLTVSSTHSQDNSQRDNLQPRQLTVSSTHSLVNSQCRQLTARQVTAKTTHSHTNSQHDNSQPHQLYIYNSSVVTFH